MDLKVLQDMVDNALASGDFERWIEKQDAIERNRILKIKNFYNVSDPISYENLWHRIKAKKTEKESKSKFVYGNSFYSNIEDVLIDIAKSEGSETEPLADCDFLIEAYSYMGVTIELMHGQGVCAFIYDHNKQLIHHFG